MDGQALRTISSAVVAHCMHVEWGRTRFIYVMEELVFSTLTARRENTARKTWQSGGGEVWERENARDRERVRRRGRWGREGGVTITHMYTYTPQTWWLSLPPLLTGPCYRKQQELQGLVCTYWDDWLPMHTDLNGCLSYIWPTLNCNNEETDQLMSCSSLTEINSPSEIHFGIVLVILLMINSQQHARPNHTQGEKPWLRRGGGHIAELQLNTAL